VVLGAIFGLAEGLLAAVRVDEEAVGFFISLVPAIAAVETPISSVRGKSYCGSLCSLGSAELMLGHVLEEEEETFWIVAVVPEEEEEEAAAAAAAMPTE
jgi:hypothetical protein